MKLSAKVDPKLAKLLSRFIPIILVVLPIPILLIALNSTSRFTLFSRAQNRAELRLWLTPASLMSAAGRAAKFEVTAEFENETDFVPVLSLLVAGDPKLGIAPIPLNYPVPFRGRVVVGTVTVTPLESGRFQLFIPPASVTTSLLPSAKIITSGASLIVKP